MLTEIKQIIQTDRRIQWILLGGLVIQLITCITAIGTSSADQHFQIIEFSLYQLGQKSGATTVWEIDHFVRPTLQVYLFSGYHLTCNLLGLTDPYAQLTLLRIVLGLVMFMVFNLIAIYYYRQEPRKILIYVLLLLNFSWSLPYTRTLFCSEMVSSLFFFGTLVLYIMMKDKRPGFIFLALIGLLFSLSFYFRFQIGFALAGFGIWMLLFEKKYQHLLPIAAGFILGILINVYLDYGFYKEWVFTPYEYFYVNIFGGRADSFGTSSFMRYIGLILLVAPAPLFSILLFYYSIKAFFIKFMNPLFLSVMLFIVAHSIVGHKEERFLFPVFNVFPVIIGWAIPNLEQFYLLSKQWIQYLIKITLGTTIVLNTILLIAITSIPYSQTILFSYLLKKKFDNKPVIINCLGQTPFETPSGNKMVFYKNGAENINLNRINNMDSIRLLSGKDLYLSTTFNEIKKYKSELKNMGYQPVMYSSGFLWKLNEMLQSKNMNTINEIWILYKKSE